MVNVNACHKPTTKEESILALPEFISRPVMIYRLWHFECFRFWLRCLLVRNKSRRGVTWYFWYFIWFVRGIYGWCAVFIEFGWGAWIGNSRECVARVGRRRVCRFKSTVCKIFTHDGSWHWITYQHMPTVASSVENRRASRQKGQWSKQKQIENFSLGRKGYSYQPYYIKSKIRIKITCLQ